MATGAGLIGLGEDRHYKKQHPREVAKLFKLLDEGKITANDPGRLDRSRAPPKPRAAA